MILSRQATILNSESACQKPSFRIQIQFRNAARFGGVACLICGAHGSRVNTTPVHALSTKKGKGSTVVTTLVAARDQKGGEELYWEYGGTCTRKHEAIKCACCGGWLFEYIKRDRKRRY